MALRKGNQDAPACTDCHGEHGILSTEGPALPRRGRQRVGPGLLAVPHLAEGHGKVGPSAGPDADLRRQLPRPRGPRRSPSRWPTAPAATARTTSSRPRTRPPGSARPTWRRPAAHRAAIPGPTSGSRTARSTSPRRRRSSRCSTGSRRCTSFSSSPSSAECSFTTSSTSSESRRGSMQVRRGEIVEPPAGRGLYLRMTLGERLQHGDPHGELHPARRDRVHAPLPRRLVGPRPAPLHPRAHFDVRSLVHRISAVVMVASSLYHVAYLTLTAAGTPVPARHLVARPGPSRRGRRAEVQHGPLLREAAVRPVQLHREERVLGARLGHGRDGRHGHRHVVRQHVHRPPRPSSATTSPAPSTSTRPGSRRSRSSSGTSTSSSSTPTPTR